MTSKPRTKRQAFNPAHVPEEVEGLPYSLETHKGEVLEQGTLGRFTQRGRGATLYDREGRKVCGICPETGVTTFGRNGPVFTMNNGRRLAITMT